ncbi:MAG: gliding motility-associated C-terminal domain-containing protein [Bacteroidetes bacterium]|nr:gliding motility-associated C-terminal domain-containing protein [Bacteroidota bacterium]
MLRLFFLAVVMLLFAFQALCQDQTCPININFSTGDISNWSAKTGLVGGSVIDYPAPNAGTSTIPEYSITTTGIKVNTASGNDKYGGFPIVPTINGYSYGYSVKIGSDATSWDLHSNVPSPGGFTRSITYSINVPSGPVSVPYTMTYAYAMVLENGTHNSNQQPLFKATLNASGNIIACASPSYYLPTLNDATNGNDQTPTGATLDSAKAKANGFSVSPILFLSHAGQQGNNGTLLQDVWTKGWTEVTFDLSPYRGQTVTLTFESDNCTPGAHFAYAYVALRNNCAGLQISGFPDACANTSNTYSIPALANGTYSWTVPPGWAISSGINTNIINVTPGTTPGIITAREVNSCADLRDTINVNIVPPTVAGRVINNNTVCAGTNSTALTLTGQAGNILNWISSTDGINWSAIVNTTNGYTASNLDTTTQYRAVVQNGNSCSIDTSTAAIIVVDPKTISGFLSPDNINICAGQTINSFINLSGNIGSVVNWQSSFDSTNWTNFSPANTGSSYNVNTINRATYFRTIVKSGVCPADTSSAATIKFINTPFPAATFDPANASICYGKTVQLNTNITTGTAYTWNNINTLTNQGNGVVSSRPYAIHAIASPSQSTDYVLTVTNAGCPNVLTDTFHIAVTQPIIVFAGNDTSIVARQPLQLNITVSDPLANQYTWTPPTGLNFTDIPNPIANLGTMAGNSITYIVRATKADGCYGEDNIKVTVFTTLPDIFVPSAFTPNGDGRNDILKPICVGISKLNYFRIYNRWGQLVFSTSEMGRGWDGLISGSQQPTSNFVYIAQGIDYTGKTITKKGNVVLVQ